MKKRRVWNATGMSVTAWRSIALISAMAVVTGCSQSKTASNNETKPAVAEAPQEASPEEVPLEESPVGPPSDQKSVSLKPAKPGASPKSRQANADYHFNKGEGLRGARDYEGAIREYTMAIKQSPSDGAFYKNLGATYALIGKMDEAEKTLTKGTEISPKDWLMWNNLAVVLQHQQKFDQCKTVIEKSLTLNPPADKAKGLRETLAQLNAKNAPKSQ